MPIVLGWGRNVNNALQVDTVATSPAESLKRHGIAVVAAQGAMYCHNATAGVPAGTPRHGGVAITVDGKVCTTTTKPSAATIRNANGLAVDTNGSVVTTTAAPTASSRWVHGTPIGSVMVNVDGLLHIAEV